MNVLEGAGEQVVRFAANGAAFHIAAADVERIIALPGKAVSLIPFGVAPLPLGFFCFRGVVYPLVGFNGLPLQNGDESMTVLLLKAGKKYVGIAVDSVSSVTGEIPSNETRVDAQSIYDGKLT